MNAFRFLERLDEFLFKVCLGGKPLAGYCPPKRRSLHQEYINALRWGFDH